MMSGPMLIRGYWNRPDATAETIENGWLHTGDGGYIDEEGFLFIKDRIKDMILRGGENIFCSEVEGSIYEHPSVHEVAVFGVPHERLGEEVAVAIKVTDGASLTAEDLWKFLDGKISSFKVPSHVVIMNEDTCIVEATARLLKFYEAESCGQCSQCREGSHWLARMFYRIESGKGTIEDLEQIGRICSEMAGQTICVFSDAVTGPVS